MFDFMSDFVVNQMPENFKGEKIRRHIHLNHGEF